MRKGFTLWEILVVLIVLGILLAVLLPNWSAIFGQTDNATALAEAQTVANELLSVLLGEHSDDAADFVIFIQKGSGIFTYGYDASQTKLLQCRIAAEGADLSDRTKTVEPLLRAGAITLAEGNDRYLWRMPKRFDKTVEKIVQENGYDTGSIRVYAAYEILPVNFDAEASRPSDCAHTDKKIELKKTDATCSLEGCGACFICTDCGAMFATEESTDTTERTVTHIDVTAHKWFYTQIDGTQHRKYCEYCEESHSEGCKFDEETGTCVCGRKKSGQTAQSSFTIDENGRLCKDGQPFTGLNESDLGEHGLYYFEGSLADGEADGQTFSEGRLVICASAKKLEPTGYLLRVQKKAEISPHTRELVYRFPLLECSDLSAGYTISAENLTVLGLRLSGLESDPLFGAPWTQTTLAAYASRLATGYELSGDFYVPYTDDYKAYNSQSALSYNDFIRYKYGAFLHRTKDGFRCAYLECGGKQYAAYAFPPENGEKGLVIYSPDGTSLRAAAWTVEGTESSWKIRSGENKREKWTLCYDASEQILTVEPPFGGSFSFVFRSFAFSGDLSEVTFATPEPEALCAYAVLPASGEAKPVGAVADNPTALEYLHRALWQTCTLCSCADAAHAEANQFPEDDAPLSSAPFHLYCPLARFVGRFGSAVVLWPSADVSVAEE